jgi:hypothetical protein
VTVLPWLIRTTADPDKAQDVWAWRILEIGNAGRRSGGGGSEGVGEHVRTNFQPGQLTAGETAERERPHRTKKTRFFCQTDLKTRAPRSSI